MTTLIALATLIMGLAGGYFSREVRNMLKRIEMAVQMLYSREKTKEQKEKKMGLAEPMTMAEYMEMEEEDRLDALNQ